VRSYEARQQAERGGTARPAHPLPWQMAGAVGDGDDGEASGLCFFSVRIGWPEQLMAATGRLLLFFIFFCNVCRA
jgi:hypothetical protein